MSAAATQLRPALPAVLWHSVRTRSLPIAVLSSLVGTLALLPAQRPQPLIAALCMLLAVLLQCGTNVLNDAEDSRTGADDFPAAGSSRAMKAGWVDATSARLIALGFFVLAALVGVLIVVIVSKPALLILGAGALLVGWAYTAPPLRLAYRPLGELASALPMGIGIPWGTAAAQTNDVPAAVWFAAIPLALLTAAILHANNARDRTHDASVGKRTLATFLSPRGVVVEYQALLILGPLITTLAIAFKWMPIWTALAILPGVRAIAVSGRASTDLDARGWTMLLITTVKLFQLTALALAAGFLLSLIR